MNIIDMTTIFQAQRAEIPVLQVQRAVIPILQAQRAEIPQPGPAARDMFGVEFAA